MSNLLAERRPAKHFSRRLIILLLVAIVVAFFSSIPLINTYVQWLWFSSLNYAAVFMTTFHAKIAAYVAFFTVTLAVLAAWESRLFRGIVSDDVEEESMAALLLFRIAMSGILIAVPLAFGSYFLSNWQTIALWFYAPTSGSPDPIFGRPLSFYLFTLPAVQLLLGWAWTVVLLMLGSAAAMFLLMKFRYLQWRKLTVTDTLSRRAPRMMNISIGLSLVLLSASAIVDRYTYLYAAHASFVGVGYTDAHVRIGGDGLLAAIALLCGVWLLIPSAKRNPKLGWRVAAPYLLCLVILQVVGWYMDTFIVRPNELERQRSFIAENIANTRKAFALDRVDASKFPAESNAAAIDPADNQATIDNIRLWDWHALQSTLRQIQEIRTYYDFPDVDIDRYTFNGKTQEVMLAARELSVDKLPVNSQNWINEKLIYTHGYGLTMNSVNSFTPEGMPSLYLRNMPVESTVPELKVTRPEIYFGEMTNTDVYVKTRQKEFDYPQGERNSMASYSGTGGIRIGGWLRRLLIAFNRGDLTKLPFNDDVTPDSRMLMHRNVLDRVSTLAPFIAFDPDPYIVLRKDGRLVWMVDGYTRSSYYPDSTPYTFLNGEQINYLRNSVKAVVDAYDGTTTFYVFDPTDPIIQAYRRLFPTLFKDASSMPEDLRQHVRYPEIMLREQAAVYGLYHMQDPQVFYNREDLWTVASDTTVDSSGQLSTRPLEPNYVLMKLPGEQNMEFVAILPFTPSNRNNMIGWIAGRSDGDHYGTATVFDFPKTKLVDGPLQIDARIDQDATLSGQLTLWNQQGSHVQRGNLLVIPCGKAVLYAEPIYLQAERSPMPEMRLVVLALQDRLAYGPTFQTALQSLFGGSAPTVQQSTTTQVSSGPIRGTTSESQSGLITAAAQAFSDYQKLTAQGRMADAGQKLDELKADLGALVSHQK